MVLNYKYRPVAYFGTAFFFTWINWFVSAYFSHIKGCEAVYMIFMMLGLFAPATVALVFILRSGNRNIKKEYLSKAVSLRRIKPLSFIEILAIVAAAIAVSILISTLFGQPISQFTLAKGFSFSVGTAPTLLVLVIAAFFEEFGWRGYGMDSLLQRYSLFKSSWIFAVIWACWHLPLFLIANCYQYNIMQQNIWFAVNFVISTIPLTFVLNWLCVKNRGSILAAIILHFLINLMQEATNMNQISKCIETGIIAVIAVIIVLTNKELFFNKTEDKYAQVGQIA